MNSVEAKLAVNEMPLRFAGQPNHRMTLGRLALWLTVLLVFLWVGRLNAQQQQSSLQGPVVNGGNVYFPHSEQNPGDSVDMMLRQKRLHQMREAQHKTVVSYAEKLLTLVTKLNAVISSTNPVALTPDQLRKVAEVEKLARNVRDMMTISMQ